ncbi:MAG: M81 family metallopeptidase [Deltaproteobacteria bacterium]|nr:M81 family metallopeptidase [Deltaproteobacteria bacterium]
MIGMLGRLGRGERPLRIAYGRIFHEGNAFSVLPTTRERFMGLHVHEGEALAQKCTLKGHELEGFLRHAELTGFVQAARAAGGVTTVPLFSAMTVPSGQVTPETFAWLRERLQDNLRKAGPVDAVYLALHGSMQVAGLGASPEGVILDDVRALTGGVPIAASFDLHGNLCPAIVDKLTILTAYRTNPHRDLLQTGFRAGNRLIRALRGQVAPTHAWRKLPMLLGGGTTVDLLAPMRGYFRYMRGLERDPKVLGAHLFMVHPYSDAPDLGWAVHVTTDDDQALADQLADDLADRAFALRTAPLPPMRTVEEALADVKGKRLARKTGTVSLVDVGDIVGAGAPGGNTQILQGLLQQPSLPRIYLPIHDPDAVKAAADVAVGQPVTLQVRGIPGRTPQPVVPLSGTLAARVENESGTVIRVDTGTLSVALTSGLPLTISPRFWRELGLSPWEADAIVQKMFFHYRFFYAAVNRANIPVGTEGPTSLENLRKMSFDLPMWPQQEVSEWRSFDEVRRGVPRV